VDKESSAIPQATQKGKNANEELVETTTRLEKGEEVFKKITEM